MIENAYSSTVEAQRAVSAAVGVRKGDVNQTDGLLRRAAGRPGNSRDTDAKCRANTAANPLRESLSHFGADGAFGFNQLNGHIRPGDLEIIAVANHSAQ